MSIGHPLYFGSAGSMFLARRLLAVAEALEPSHNVRTQRVAFAKYIMTVADKLLSFQEPTPELTALAASFENIVEALIPKFGKDVKPYDPKKISRIVEKPQPKTQKKDVGIIENAFPEEVEYGTNNIVVVWNKAKKELPAEEFEMFAKWYDHAHEDVKAMAEKYNLPLDLTAAVVAVLSPNTKWIPNLQVAERTIRLAASFLEYGGRDIMESKILKTGKLVNDLIALEKQWAGKIHKEKIPMGMRDKVYSQLGKIRRLLRKKRELYNGYSKEYKNTIQEHLGGLAGSKEKIGNFIDSYPRNIRKALNMIEEYEDEHPEVEPTVEESRAEAPAVKGTDPAIAKWLKGPKVEAFYRALLEPTKSTDELVADGHVVQLWLGTKGSVKSSPKPMGNRRKKILQSFTDAAKELGVPIRSVQAVTWYYYKYIIENNIDLPLLSPEDAQL